MSETFDPKQGPILLRGQLSGPVGRANFRFLLDTGSTRTWVDQRILVQIGLDPTTSPDRIQTVKGNGLITTPRVILNRLTALGQHRFGFAVLAHDLPAEAGVDGLLGLDFLRGLRVTLDFRSGIIDLT